MPCGPAMTLCNNAFIDLAKRLDDIFSSNFNESPKGDKERLSTVADNLILLLTNSYYSLTWLNSRYYKTTHPEDTTADTDTDRIAQISQQPSLKHYLDKHAIASYEKWMSTNKFQTCRLCTSCGGDWPNYMGEGYARGDWGFWLRYRESCQAQLYSESGPPNLCCSADEPPCQYCSSCGGEFSQRVGRKLNRGDWGPFNVKGSSCSGDYRESYDEFEICCKNRKQCKMCEGNCANSYT